MCLFCFFFCLCERNFFGYIQFDAERNYLFFLLFFKLDSCLLLLGIFFPFACSADRVKTQIISTQKGKKGLGEKHTHEMASRKKLEQ